MLRPTTPLLPALCALAFAACGEDDDRGRPSGTTVQVVFGREGMAVTPATVVSGEDVSLSVSSQDGRPHGVTLDGAPTPTRVVVRPGETRQLAAGTLPDGTYGVAPDGVGEPVTLTVGRP